MISLQQSFSAQTLNDHLRRTSNSLQQNIHQLSSGSRVGHKHNEESIYHISSRFRFHESNFRYGAKNMATASTMLSVVDDGLATIDELLTRMRTVANTASSSTITSAERNALSVEFQTLSEEIDRIAFATRFGDVHVLNGGISSREFGLEARGLNRAGGVGNDVLVGGVGSDTISGGAGNDIMNGAGGGDIFRSGLQVNALDVEVFRNGSTIHNINDANSVVADSNNLFLNYRATSLNYTGNDSTLAEFLGNDASSVSNMATASSTVVDNLAFRMRGSIAVEEARLYTFSAQGSQGFSVSINGQIVVDQFCGCTSFVETATIHLDPGVHSIEIIYFDRDGLEKFEVRSDIAGQGMQILDGSDFLSPSAGGSGSDGNDTLLGAAEYLDIAEYSGNKTDYRITQISEDEFMIEDLRSGSPNGRDLLRHIDEIEFADGNYTLKSPMIARTLDFHSEGHLHEPLSYEILNLRTNKLFTRTPTMSLDSMAQAEDAKITLEEASARVAFYRTYVGNLQSESELRYEHSTRSMNAMTSINSSLFDTDIAKTSAEFAQALLKINGNVLMRVQSNNMQENILALVNGA